MQGNLGVNGRKGEVMQGNLGVNGRNYRGVPALTR
jgi:hypothetical protein